MSDNNTQLTQADGYTIDRLIFAKSKKDKIPNSTPPIFYRRIVLSTTNEDGSVGDLILPTVEVFSYGVSENLDPKTNEVNGYVMPLCLWSKDGATPEEKAWTDTFERIADRTKDYILEHKRELESYEVTRGELRKLNPLYWKKVEGKRVEGLGPTLYAKLIVSKKQNKILSQFYDYNGNDLDPMSLMGKYCRCRAAVKIESIFIGAGKYALQVKLYECEVKLLDTGMKRLLSRPRVEHKVETKSNPFEELKHDSGDEGSVHGSDDEKDDDAAVNNNADDDETANDTTPSSPKKPVKRLIKKRIGRRVKKSTADE